MLTALPPRPITSDKSEAATTEVATALVAEPPAPPPPPASDVTEAATERWQPRWPPHNLRPRLSPSMHLRQRQRSPRWLVPRHPCRVGNPRYHSPNRKRWFVRLSRKPLPPSRNWRSRTSPHRSKTQARKRPSSLAAARGLGRRWRLPRPTSLSSRCPRLDRTMPLMGAKFGRRLPGISLGPACAAAPRWSSPSARTAACAACRSGDRAAIADRSAGACRRCAVRRPSRRRPSGVATYTIRIDFQ